ncbi:unnamed protein product [Lasius platythorax]|uniref:Uncharacterized protein n=1 Tax=Lasius platythorax TaxID=488582 RepID=A0AAV2N280_9HYME
MQNRVLAVTDEPSELLEQHPRDRHPWYGNVPRIREQESAESETQRIHETDKKRALPIMENDDRSIERRDAAP